MQMRHAQELLRKWKKRGYLHCRHPHVEKEYRYDTQTGDMVCTTCGTTVKLENKEQNKRA
jgi:Fe2+ or Zn2+ uptake regulation protein